VREIERSAKLGHRGVLFTGEPQRFAMPLLGDRHWDPLYAAAQDAGLPISFHIGSGNFEEDFSPERLATHGIAPTMVRSAVSLFLDNGKQLVDLLLSGVLPRFPSLRFVSVESGIGVIPVRARSRGLRLRAGLCAPRAAGVRAPAERLLPAPGLRLLLLRGSRAEAADRSIGADNVLFETDYPHPICLYGNVRAKVDAGLEDSGGGAPEAPLRERRASLRSARARSRLGAGMRGRFG